MDRDKWLLLFSILIFTALGIYYLPSWLGRSAQKRPASGEAAKLPARQPLAQARPSASAAATRDQSELIDGRGPWGRNPFLTEAETSGPQADNLKVKAIILGPPRAVAVVEGQTVQVGEKIAGETVAEIRADEVILERDGKRRSVRLGEPTVSIEIKDGKR